MNNEIKLHQALYEMKAVAEQLYPLYKALTDEIEQLTEDVFDLGTRLIDNAKSIEKE